MSCDAKPCHGMPCHTFPLPLSFPLPLPLPLPLLPSHPLCPVVLMRQVFMRKLLKPTHTYYPLLTTHYSPPTIHYSQPTTHYPLLTTQYPIPNTHCSHDSAAPGGALHALSAARFDDCVRLVHH